MNPELSDAMIDAQLLSYLRDRAEDGATRARTPEQVVAAMATATRPRFWSDRLVQRPALLAWLVALALLVLALLAALAVGGWLRSPIPIRIAIELPFGRADSAASSIAHGVELAVNDMNGRTGRFRIEIPRSVVLSDTIEGKPDDPLGATNMASIAADPDVVAVIGPFNSSVAHAQLPISRAAGLLQCSPANTDPQLTRPSAESDPGRANYIRVVTTDDVAAAGAARYVFERLGKTSVAVLDDNQGSGAAMADWFEAEFTRLGGNVVWRAGLSNTTAGISTMLASARATNPQAIYFGGSGDAAATLVKSAADAGLGGIPFIGTDALNNGSAAAPGSFLNLAGAGARQAYSVFPGLANGPGTSAFESRYRTFYGAETTPFAAFGYACAQVVIAALQQVDPDALASATSLRDAVRAAGVDTNTTFDTIVGPIGFDAHGDVTAKWVAIYAVDPVTASWAAADQIDAAAAPGR